MSQIDGHLPTACRQQAEAAGQAHLFACWNDLSPEQQESLLSQVASLDFALLARLWSQRGKIEGDSVTAKVARAQPLQDLVRIPHSSDELEERRQARATGETLLREGRVGVILVAGGEGSRLGLSGPKGMFPIGPASQHSLYQILAEQVVAHTRRVGRPVPYCLMTSHATDQATREFFASHSYFGLDPRSVHFVRQGVMPAVDRATGQILMSGPGTIAMNPNGHGGLLQALQDSGMFDRFRHDGVELLYYHQVDNPLAQVCDPVLLGLHRQRQAQVTVKVVAKQTPEEKMGVLTSIDGQVQILEYSDLNSADVRRTTAAGDLLFWAGNTAIHVFDRETLATLSRLEDALPYHQAIKKVSSLDASGRLVVPQAENAIKYERFIFDVLPRIQKCLVVEAPRDEEFCPLKNATGEFSADHVRQALHARSLAWLSQCCRVPEGVGPIEISPLRALAAEDLDGWQPPAVWPSGPLFIQ
ncbi:MAG: UTP--glucose-1-phosphate uridylyltransferase [Planctomycetaceae bacterium]